MPRMRGMSWIPSRWASAKNRVALRLRVPVDHVGPNVGLVAHQPIEDVDTLIGATKAEVTEQRDELVGDMVVADAAAAAVDNVVLGQRILLVQVPLGAIGRRVFAAAQ